MIKGYLLAHDLGTSGNKATIFDTDGHLVASSVYTYNTIYSKNCWVEQDSEDWWTAICVTTRELMKKARVCPTEILCVSFSGQMMGCLLIDHHGNPLRNMITWADTRAREQEARMIGQVGMERGYHITGHRLSASYSAAKLLWIKENEPDIYRKAHKILHAKDFIIYRLTGNIVTDYSDASGTNLLDISRKTWSLDLLDAFSLRPDLLPELHPSTDIAGKVTTEAAKACGLAEGTPVIIGGGDGSCACVGAGVVREGKAYNVIGTSSWISNAARKPYFDPLMRTFNWIHLDHELYTPCGTMQSAGLSYQWYKNTLCRQEESLAKSKNCSVYELLDQDAASAAHGANGVIFLPYLIGERSPQWNLNARAAFIGISASTTKSELSRSILEGVGYNLRIILEAVTTGQLVDKVIVIGGGAKGRTWLQILSDIWQKPLAVPQYMEEATSMGAAICGGVGIGLYRDFTECADFNKVEIEIQPNPDCKAIYDWLYLIFQQAYEGLIPAYQQLADYRQHKNRG